MKQFLVLIVAAAFAVAWAPLASAEDNTNCTGCNAGQDCKYWLGEWKCVTPCCDDSKCSGETCYKKRASDKLGVCLSDDGKAAADIWFAKRSASSGHSAAKKAEEDRDAEAKARAEADAKALKAEADRAAEAKARAEADAKALKAEADRAAEAKARAEAEAKAKVEAEARKKAEAEAKKEKGLRPHEIGVLGYFFNFLPMEGMEDENAMVAFARFYYRYHFGLKDKFRPFAGGGVESGALPDGRGFMGPALELGFRAGDPDGLMFFELWGDAGWRIGFYKGSGNRWFAGGGIGPGFNLGSRGSFMFGPCYTSSMPGFDGRGASFEDNFVGVCLRGSGSAGDPDNDDE